MHVQALCKGKCGKLTVHTVRPLSGRPDHYSQNSERPFYNHEAVCNVCGRIAKDNYNWIVP